MRGLVVSLSTLGLAACLPCTWDEFDPDVRISTWDQEYQMTTRPPSEGGTPYRITPRQVFQKSMAAVEGRYCSAEDVSPTVRVNVSLTTEPDYEAMQATMTGNVCTGFATEGELKIATFPLEVEWSVEGGAAGRRTMPSKIYKSEDGPASVFGDNFFMNVDGFHKGERPAFVEDSVFYHRGRDHPLVKCDEDER